MPGVWEKRTKRMQKWILGGVVAIMVLSLVMWGYGPGGREEDADDPAVTLHGVTVPKYEFRHQWRRAVPYLRYELLNQFGGRAFERDSIIRQLASSPRGLDIRHTEEQIHAKTVEMLVLLHDARMKGLRVSDDEVREEATALFRATGWQDDEEKENWTRFAQSIFASDVDTFLEMLRDGLLIAKNLDYELGAAQVRFADVYQRIVEESRRARVQVASIDPDRFARDPRQVGPEAIAQHFEKNKDRYKVPDKAQVEFLLADIEVLKARQPEPTEADLKAYYEKEKDAQFVKPHEHKEGDPHKPDEPKQYREFDEVKGEIRDKIRERDARKQVKDTMDRVNTRIGEIEMSRKKEIREQVRQELQGKPPEEQAKLEQIVIERCRVASGSWLAQLKEEFKAQNVELTHDITGLFDNRHLDDAYKLFGRPEGGKDRDLAQWAFGFKEGDVSAIYASSKGRFVLRLARKVAPYVPDLNEAIRDRIARDLARDYAQAATRRLASQIEQQLNGTAQPEAERRFFNPASALRRAAEKHRVVFVQTGYFGAKQAIGEQPNLGLGEFALALANEVRERVFAGQLAPPPRAGAEPPAVPPLAPGWTFTIDGSAIGADKQLWAYVVFVEDVVGVTPDNVAADFKRQRDELQRQKAFESRGKHVQDLVAVANVQDHMQKKPKPTDAPPAP